MQTYIVSFAVFLCIGITMRLIHPESYQLATPYVISAAFLLAASILSFIYRSRVLAFLFLIAALCVFMFSLPLIPELNNYMMGVFAALFIVSIVLGFIKLKPLPFWILSALALGYGLTCLHLDQTSPTHLVQWGGDSRNDQSLVYGTIVKEPEVRPEKNDTRLIIKPSIVVKLGQNPNRSIRLNTINQIITEIKDLNRPWETEEEVLSTLLLVREKLDKAQDQLIEDEEETPSAETKDFPEELSEEEQEEVIKKVFSTGDYTPSAEDVEVIQMALEEIGPSEPGKGWVSLIDKGWALITVVDYDLNKEEIYPAISHYSAYGDQVKIIAPLTFPAGATNPGGFDYKAYLSQINTFTITKIRGKINWTTKELDTIEIIKPASGNFFINWCMGIKYKLLAVIRQTTPFPESGFLSGIFIGLKKGVPDKIVKESQAAGTAHVFAVSGLHVTIIAGLLLLIFNQTPIPKSVWAPIAVLFLVIFTVITGARPSTLRAATMNSFVLIFFTYFGKNIQKSLLMSICFAAIVIICFFPPGYGGPLILPSASFLMSFSAVLFLGLLSGPIEDFFNFKLNNLYSLVTAAAVAVWVGLLFMNLGNPWGVLKARLFWGFLIAIPVTFLIQQVIPFRPRFSKIPGKWLRTFIAAQVAIQCSIVPLSMVIFHRMSLAAPFANFIGIPLIGIILPLGMLATLIGFIPLIGINIALIITAANWIGMHFFIWLDAFFTKTFPYPQVPKPGAFPLIVFYLIVAFFIYREKIILSVKIAFVRVKNSLTDGGCRIRAYASLAALLIAIVGITTGFISASRPELKVIYLSMGWTDGMAALIEAPNGDNILIDGGYEGWDFRKKIAQYFHKNQGQRTLEEVLLYEKIVAFDAVINTNCDARVLGGLNYIVGSDDYYIKRLYSCLPPSEFGPQDIDLNLLTLSLTAPWRGDAKRFYKLLLLNEFTPEDAMEFMTLFRSIPEKEIPAFLKSLPLVYARKMTTEKAIQILKGKEAEAYEELIESIISSEKWLHPGEEFTRAQAEAKAEEWKFSLLPPSEYLGFVANLPQQFQWFVYEKGGVIDDVEKLTSYQMDLFEKFVTAIGFEPEDPDEKVFKGEEMFLQYHRLLFSVKERNIPLSMANQGIAIIKPEKIRGKTLEATVLNPAVEDGLLAVRGKYINEVNSVVVSLKYGEVSFIFPSLLNNEGNSNLAQNIKGGLQSTIYMAPQFGKGGKYFDPTGLLILVKPEVAVFQYAGGSFGRENKQFKKAWAFCQENGIEAYNTKEMGAVTVTTDGEHYQVITSLGRPLKPGEGAKAPDKASEIGVGM